MPNKNSYTERDVCTKLINPALAKAGWNLQTQIREEVSFTDGRIIVQGKMHTRGKRKIADYIFPKQEVKKSKKLKEEWMRAVLVEEV